MNILDRLLGHDSWTTLALLELSSSLSDSQLDHEFEIGHRSIRNTFGHMVRNLEVWTELMKGNPGVSTKGDSIDELTERLNLASAKFASIAKQIEAEGRLDETWIAPDENPPKKRTYGGTITHVITHSMHHRAQLLYLLRLTGVDNLPEGDVLSWENSI